MAGYQAHLSAAGAAAGAGLAALWLLDWYRPEALMILGLIASAMLAALFPDTDTCSVGRRFFYLIMLGIDVPLIINGHYEWAAILGLFAILPAIGPHRGWTHSWWAMLAAPLPIIILPVVFLDIPWTAPLPFYLAAAAGYASHLALDRLGRSSPRV